MAQQDKISILGPTDDGTYVIEFRTAAGKKLAIKVPEAKTAVLRVSSSQQRSFHAPPQIRA
jgi:hypothetical protein